MQKNWILINLKNVLCNFSSLKRKVDKLDVDELVPVPVGLSKLNDEIKNDAVKKMYIMLRSKLLRIKYLILLTQLLILLLILK